MHCHLANQPQNIIKTPSERLSVNNQEYYPLDVIQNGIIWHYELKKCCKKYKKGNRCKKCPNN
jgi:hypothetical protein